MAWMWSPTDENLSYLCLGATSFLVPETFKFNNFETWLPMTTYNNGRVNITLSSCLCWYATLNSCKYLKSETHLRNAKVNKASSVNKGVSNTCLIVDMVRKKMVANRYCWLWDALLRFSSFWFILRHCGFLYNRKI